MELSKMIKIMTHYLNGGEVEVYKNDRNDRWTIEVNPIWDWDTFDYRIKEQKQKVTIEKWLMQSTIDKEYRIFETSLVDKVVNFKKVKLLETYEVEL